MKNAFRVAACAAAISAFTVAGAFAQTPTATPQTGGTMPSTNDASKSGSPTTAGANTKPGMNDKGAMMGNGKMMKNDKRMKNDKMSK